MDAKLKKRMTVTAGAAAGLAALALGGSTIASAVSGGADAAAKPAIADTGGESGTRERSDEQALTGDTASRVTEAALAKTGGGTVERVETDGDGNAAYEAHVVKSDGTRVTVYVDEQFNVVGVEERSGRGGHGRGDEQALTGDTASRVTEAALAKTGGGTVERVETDGDGNAAYEAHVVKSDGTRVTVYVDEQFNVVGVDQENAPGQESNA